MSIAGKLDTSQWDSVLNKLIGPARESLARSMAVAGGQVLRDEAKARVQKQSGKLERAIYLAYRDDRSTTAVVMYSISWNAKLAPHGHLQEFGHWRYNKIVNGYPQKSLINGKRSGRGPQDHGGPGAKVPPVWVPANPFLRPAHDAKGSAALDAMMRRGRERLPELLGQT